MSFVAFVIRRGLQPTDLYVNSFKKKKLLVQNYKVYASLMLCIHNYSVNVVQSCVIFAGYISTFVAFLICSMRPTDIHTIDVSLLFRIDTAHS